MSDLPPLVGVTPVGKSVPMVIIREGRKQNIDIEIGELPAEDKAEAQQPDKKPQDESLLGMVVEELSAADRKKLSISKGVRVTKVEKGAARRSGILPGDIIIQVQGKDVESVGQFKDILAKIPKDKSVPILIRREDRSLFLALRRDTE